VSPDAGGSGPSEEEGGRGKILRSSRGAYPQRKSPAFSRWALPLLGSNQDSPDPESSRSARHFRQPVGIQPLSEHRCPDSCRSLPAHARRNYGKTSAVELGVGGAGLATRGWMASFCTLGGDFSRAHAINPAGDMVGVSTTRGRTERHSGPAARLRTHLQSPGHGHELLQGLPLCRNGFARTGPPILRTGGNR
jgi:hypothetical protein